MDNVFELEFTKDELEILQIVLTPHVDTSFSIAYHAKDKGKDVNKMLELSRSLHSRICRIINNINTQ